MAKQRGRTALYLAAVNDRLANVELLIQHKASIDLGDKHDEHTALHEAAKNKDSKMLELLLKHKASTEPQTKVMLNLGLWGKELAWWLISWSFGLWLMCVLVGGL